MPANLGVCELSAALLVLGLLAGAVAQTASESGREAIMGGEFNQWLIANQESFTYATLVSTTDYAHGANLLACSLNRFHGQPLSIGLTIMWEATAATSAKKAVATLATTLEMPVRIVDVENPALGTPVANHSRLGTYAKLNVWRLKSLYVVFIDVDALAVRSPAEAFLALADKRVQIAYVGAREGFNSGVMALRPSRHVYNEITRLLWHGAHFTKDPTEQDLIVQYFSTLPNETSRQLTHSFNTRAWLKAGPTAMPVNATIVHRSGQGKEGKPWTQLLQPGRWPHNQSTKQAHNTPEWAIRLWRATLSDLLLGTCSLNSTNYATGSMQRWSR